MQVQDASVDYFAVDRGMNQQAAAR
jgi:hypothetical protein